MDEFKLCCCPKCLGTNKTSKNIEYPDGSTILMDYYTFYSGFIANEFVDECPICHGEIYNMHLTIEEWIYITSISLEQNFILAMDKLKIDDIIDFNLKISQFKQVYQSNTPKCPTCGSTNIKKISGTRRWLGVGLFGIASSDVGKTRECNDCGYKW